MMESLNAVFANKAAEATEIKRMMRVLGKLESYDFEP